MSKSWPTTPLGAAHRAFTLLTLPPTLLVFDCRGRAGLPQRILPVDELKRVLIADTTPRPVRDAVWRELVTRARRDGPAWVVVAVGIAMPGLRRAAGKLSTGWPGDSSDRDSELLTGFLTRLHTVDLDEPRICGRLIDAGVRAVKRARARVEDLDAVRVDSAWSLAPHHPWDHPDWVLARAVAAAVIDPDEALLISATRLDDTTLQTVAHTIGITVPVAAWRRKAEHRLSAALRDGEIGAIRLRCRRDDLIDSWRPANAGRVPGGRSSLTHSATAGCGQAGYNSVDNAAGIGLARTSPRLHVTLAGRVQHTRQRRRRRPENGRRPA